MGLKGAGYVVFKNKEIDITLKFYVTLTLSLYIYILGAHNMTRNCMGSDKFTVVNMEFTSVYMEDTSAKRITERIPLRCKASCRTGLGWFVLHGKSMNVVRQQKTTVVLFVII